MLFFKINITKVNKPSNTPTMNLQPKTLRSITSDIEAEYDNRISVFAKDLPIEKHIYCITKEYELIDNAVSEFFEKVSIDATKYKLKELTYDQITNILSSASRNDMIEQESNILPEAFDFMSYSIGDEHICKYSTKKKIESCIEFSPYHDELMEEFKRIYQGSKINCRYRIPVHYIIETDEDENVKTPVEALVSTLHLKKRVLSSRYNILDDSDMNSIHNLESISKDTTLVLDLRPCSADSLEFMECMSFFSISQLCSFINKTKNNIQYIFVFSKKMDINTKNEFLSHLKGISFVELHSKMLSHQEFCQRLEMQAVFDNLVPDSSLTANISENEHYSYSQIDGIYQNWVTQKLKTDVYPQYANCNTSAEILLKKTSENRSAYAELQSMIGLESVKKQIDKILSFFKLYQIYKSNDPDFEKPSMHMAFMGSPGTAKTTVARLFARILKDNKIITKGNFVEVGRADLIGQYVGWTAKIVRQKFEEAQGGVLFIDEAYSLLEEKHGLYGDEAINTIVDECEKRRNDTIVIFAGYQEPMKEFISRNPGLRSRVSFQISFEDYTPSELLRIIKLMAKNKKLNISSNADNMLMDIFSSACKSKDFGNGRFARNMIEKALMNHAHILADSPDGIDNSALFTLDKSDFEGIYKPDDFQSSKIGF